MTWNIDDARNRLSELVTLALTQGPQTIVRGQDRVVVLSAERYAELTGTRPDFKEYLMQGEGFDGLDLSRDQSPPRDVEF
jgi:prevent-host-death family protein